MSLRRRTFLKTGATSLAWLAATGCEQVPRELRALFPPQPKSQVAFQPPANQGTDSIIHILNRAGFGARPGDYERISKLGKTPEEAALAYVEEQLNPDKISDDVAQYAARRFETLGEPLGELFEYQPELLHSELMRATLVRAVLSERQLFEVMVQFWSDHFNIDPSKGDCKWLKVADDRDVIRKHALGRFPDLLRASALSPAMLWYLDGRVNRKRNPADKPNENYARELLELHTLGVHGGYTQQDVMEVARGLTGWTIRSTVEKPYYAIGKVEFKPELHDFGAKQILGHTLPAAGSGKPKDEQERIAGQELDRILEIVTIHPATARHIATKLCRHFIADAPPASAIEQVATVFTRTRGDIRETLRALFQTREFDEQRGNKLKRPFTFIASALRGCGAQTDAGTEITEYLNRMGHAPFSYPTPEGYPDTTPHWLGTLLWRWNFAVALGENKIKGTKIAFDELRKNAGGDAGLMRHILGRQPTDDEARAYHDSDAGLALLLASPAFQMS
jgi:uncharacterized protein (DUF1800 family)